MGEKVNRMRLVIILLIITLLSACSNNDMQSINKILDEFGSFIYKEEVENGYLVFYRPDIQSEDEIASNLGVMFIKKTLLGLEGTLDRSGYGSNINKETGLFSQYSPKFNDDSPFPLLYGEITNSEIKEIKVINLETDNVIESKTINAKARHIWFAFLDDPKKNTKFEIQGLSKENKVISSIVNRDLSEDAFWIENIEDNE